MPDFIKNLAQDLKLQLKRHEHRLFLRGAMAASALVANADGHISLSESGRLDQILEVVEKLKIFAPHDAIELFNAYVDDIREDHEAGRDRALKAVRSAGRELEDVTLLIKICVAISLADGQVPDDERREIEAICGILGVDPNSLGL